MQNNLFDLKFETDFEAYHRDNPKVWEMFVTFTMQAIRGGRKHIGAKMIGERIRFESTVSGNGKFKVNNNFFAYYARKFERDYPQHTGLFKFRKSKADLVIGV